MIASLIIIILAGCSFWIAKDNPTSIPIVLMIGAVLVRLENMDK